MIEKFSNFIVRKRWWVLATWVIAAVLLVTLAPSLSSIQNNDQSSFLPSKYESIQATNVAKKLSAKTNTPTDIIIFKNKSGTALTVAEQTAISQKVAQLNSRHLAHVQAVVTSPAQLSPTKQAQLATVVYSGSAQDKDTINAVADVRKALDNEVAGSSLTGGLTGSNAISYDTQDSANKALSIVGIVTILLVFFLPILIFKSPLSGVLPVLAVGIVYALSSSLIALCGHIFNFQLNQQLSVLFDVVLFGIGTDYILFLLFRYRERLRSGDRTREAVAYALSRAGEAILSAALVVIASFAALFFAQFGIFSSMAPSLVICVAVMMIAALTLVPALVAIIGEKIFWPSKAWMVKSETPSVSRKIGGLVSRRPALVAVVIVVLFGALATGVLSYNADFSSFSQPPKGTASANAYTDLTKSFPAGVLNPTPIYVTSTTPLTQAGLKPLQQKLAATQGISQVMPATIAPDHKTAVVSIVLSSDPYSSAAISDISGPVRSAAHSFNSASEHVYVGGMTSAIADMQTVTNRDLSVIFPVAAVFIFVILAVLLRSLVAPVLLLLCVSLGYVATLGATVFIFQKIGGDAGLISFIPLFMYIFVVAIGTDYNILTITRLREEVREGHSPRKAAALTVEHSSATVASAGFILAATFGSLLLAGMGFLSQMGTSIALGVALAAFIIAPFLIPSLAAVFGYVIWWPGHKPAAKKD